MTDARERYVPPAGSIPTLDVPSLDEVARLHMIGIGGAGMRNLAKLLLARGIGVSGSDLKDSKGLRELRELGADVAVGHDPAHIGDHDPDAVVVSSAIGDRNVELDSARRRGVPVWARAQALAALTAGKRGIAVAGTHGKTTTTSMVAVVLERAGLDPSFLIGGDMNESGSGARSGEGELFVFEADESDGSFLLAPHPIGIVTNVDVDHVDFYPGGRDEIESAFAEFMTRCEIVVACGDDPGVRPAMSLADMRVVTYGTDPANDWTLAIERSGPAGRGAVAVPTGRDYPDAPGGRRTQPPERRRRRGDRRAGGVAAGCRRRSAGGVRRACVVGSSSEATPVAPTSMTTTGMSRRARRDVGRGSGAPGRPAGGGLPAPSVLPDAGALARAGREPDRGGRRRGDRCLRRGSRPRSPVSRGSSSSTGSPRPRRRRASSTCRTAKMWCASSATRSRAGDLVVTMGCGDVWMLGDAALERIREAS